MAQPTACPQRSIAFRDVTFAYPAAPGRPVLRNFSLEIPAGSSLAIVGQNGAGKTTLAKLLCRLYDPQSGAIEADGTDLRDLDLESWRRRVTAVFQDFTRFELTLRENVVPRQTADGRYPEALDDAIRAALDEAGATDLAGLDTPLAKGYAGGTDLSGGQWQRVALARALASVRLGAGLVLLDEPTAQLDVRGEMEIFERILAATRQCTTILISHRFSTVRHADRIAVVEDGNVVELGSHDELMRLRGRYWRMFSLQAQRFAAGDARGRRGGGDVRCPLMSGCAGSPAAATRCRQGSALDVAAVPPRVPLRAGADGHRLRPRAGRGAARRAARGLVHAARQGPAREQPRPAAVRHRGARGLRGGDLAAADRVHQDPAALQGQGHDRPGVPRGAAAGDHRHDRAPGAAGIPGPAVRAAGADLHPRPHVLLGVLHGGLDPAARPSPWRCSPP